MKGSAAMNRLLVATLALTALASLAACANNPGGDTSRENSTPSVYESNSGRMDNPQFPVGSRNSAPN
jgi:ABC-type oligopeptide transport system substrate-binding subunit